MSCEPDDRDMMEFTGERIVPGSVDADLLNEHICRYRFARLLVEEKVVLDVGSGVGYGSKILAEKASSVLAVDVSEEAIRYTGEKYAAKNIEMVVGDGQELPLASDSVDVVVSFELIEHLQGQQAHLAEVSRVLKPDGLTVISTPNRIFYSQESNQANPFHTHEFDFREFLDVLKSVFSSVEIYFQNHIAGLIVGNPSLYREVDTFLQEDVDDLQATSNFFVAVCAHGRQYQPAPGNFCLLSGSGNLLRERQLNIQRLEEVVARLDRALTRLQGEYEQRSSWALQLNRQVKSRDRSLMQLRAEFEDRSRWADELSSQADELSSQVDELSSQKDELSSQVDELSSQVDELSSQAEELTRQLDEKDKAILKLQSEFEDRTRWALEMEAKLEAIRQSSLYKLAKLLGLKLKA